MKPTLEQKTEAKELCLEIWRCLRDNPYIDAKSNLPNEICLKIFKMRAWCPLCDIFDNCDGCPLDKPICACSCDQQGDYVKWECATTDEERQIYAGKIVKVIEAWKPKSK